MFVGTICGRLSRDPEQKGAVVKFGIAVDQGYGEKKRGVFWNCIAFGKTGERVMQMWSKGKPMLASVRIEEEEWDDRTTGQKRKATTVIVESAHFVPNDSTRGEQVQAPQASYNGPEDDIGF